MQQNINADEKNESTIDENILLEKYGKLLRKKSGKRIYPFVKRTLDIILSLCALIVFLPFFIILAPLIKIESKGPVIFRQQRIGKHKNVFTLYKLRTMYIDAPPLAPTMKIPDYYHCITKIGNFLRKSSLDEFPQFLNILKGDMSLIGPRPIIGVEKELIEERDKRGAYEISPGLTGLAQINGRDYVDPIDKAVYDAFYAKYYSFKLDFHILWTTALSVLRSEGIH